VLNEMLEFLNIIKKRLKKKIFNLKADIKAVIETWHL
jgi:hypothetical protein